VAQLSYAFTTLAQTGDDFLEFAPYVASINEAGVVAFQARRTGAGTGIFSSEGDAPRSRVDMAGNAIAAAESHPDGNDKGQLSFYGRDEQGRTGLYLVVGDRCRCVVPAGQGLQHMGPLGPTMSAGGTIAFRATSAEGKAGIYTWKADVIETIALAGERFAAFAGLPVISSGGAVAFRSDLPEGDEGIHWQRGEQSRCIADTRDEFVSLGRFPSMGSGDEVAFVAKKRDGSSGAYQSRAGGRTTIATSARGFESFRGVLAPHADRYVFYATPVGGPLAIYAGPDPDRHRVLGIGDDYAGSSIVGFALNPVSMNRHGQLALRLELATGQQAIVRADPIS
jgi:hypothetical protein